MNVLLYFITASEDTLVMLHRNPEQLGWIVIYDSILALGQIRIKNIISSRLKLLHILFYYLHSQAHSTERDKELYDNLVSNRDSGGNQ